MSGFSSSLTPHKHLCYRVLAPWRNYAFLTSFKHKSLDIKNDVELSEIAPGRDLILERYALIRDKSAEERRQIEKSLVRKLDFKFLPMVTAMLMMNLVIYSIQYDLRLNCSQLS